MILRCGCGGIPVIMPYLHDPDVKEFTYIQCSKCGIRTPPYYQMDDAVNAWNKAMTARSEKGKWIEDGQIRYKHLGQCYRILLQLKCSSCGKITMVDDSIAYEYCPHCGSKMKNDE